MSLPVFVQVDLAGEETKSGITENELQPAGRVSWTDASGLSLTVL